MENGIPADLLAGRTAVVAGGTGSVGRVAVGALLEAGATVVVPSRSPDKLERFHGDFAGAPADRLITMVGDLSDEEDGVRVREEIVARAGPPDAAIATLGGFAPAPRVLDAPLADLRFAIDGYLVAHFMVAKALIPALEERAGSYTFINGPLAFRPLYPGSGLISIASAGQAMLAQTVMKEEADGPVRINELVLYTSFGWGRDAKQRGAVGQEDVGALLALLASDRGAAVRGQTIHFNELAPLNDLQS